MLHEISVIKIIIYISIQDNPESQAKLKADSQITEYEGLKKQYFKNQMKFNKSTNYFVWI